MLVFFKYISNNDSLWVSTRIGEVFCIWEGNQTPKEYVEYDVTLEIEDVISIYQSKKEEYKLSFDDNYIATVQLIDILEEKLYLFKVETDQIMIELSSNDILKKGNFYTIIFKCLRVFDNSL